MPVSLRNRLAKKLLRWFRHDPDAGIHSAAEVVLRHWGLEPELREATGEIARSENQHGRGRRINSEGHTMVVLSMEKPDNKQAHRFAVATREVTSDQFSRFLQEHPLPRHRGMPLAGRNGPIDSITWYEAAQYCRWLSEQEGIPEDEMCFPPVDQIGTADPPSDTTRRLGYRLPTRSEWDHACRSPDGRYLAYWRMKFIEWPNLERAELVVFDVVSETHKVVLTRGESTASGLAWPGDAFPGTEGF